MKLCLLLIAWQVPLLQAPEHDVEVVAFFGVDCPLARLYVGRLNELRAEFPMVRFRACAPNRRDDAGKVAAFQSALDFPIEKNVAEARRLGATCSPEVFLIHAGRVVYSGRIDDQYTPGRRRPAPTRRDLAFAIEEVLQGQAVTVPRVEPEGCRLSLDAPTSSLKEGTGTSQSSNSLGCSGASLGAGPLFQRAARAAAADAQAIVHARCAVCHHPGTAAPFSLLSIEDARAWRETIRDVVIQGRMPPWGAARGEFANDRRLSAAERQALLDWIDAGCPDGDGVKAPEFPEGWSFTPDLVQEAPPFEVPASGTLEYREFWLPVFARDTWVRAIEMRGSRAVHHINALLEPPQADPRVRYALDGDDYLATMVAGNPGIELPAGTAKLIPRGWRIKLEIHYEPIGQSVLDRSAIALKLADGPCRRVITRTLLNDDIVLPPNSLATFEQAWRLDRDYTLLAIFPHMHLRGKSMRVEVCVPHRARS